MVAVEEPMAHPHTVDRFKNYRQRTFSVSPKITLRSSPLAGMGLFVTEPVRAGEILYFDTRDSLERNSYSLKEVEAFTEAERAIFDNFHYQYREDRYHGPKTREDICPVDFMNHSCDPNAMLYSDCLMVARRHMYRGDEITYDYSTTEFQPYLTGEVIFEKCLCGEKSCRGLVTVNDWKEPYLQLKYGINFSEAILKRIGVKNA